MLVEAIYTFVGLTLSVQVKLDIVNIGKIYQLVV